MHKITPMKNKLKHGILVGGTILMLATTSWGADDANSESRGAVIVPVVHDPGMHANGETAVCERPDFYRACELSLDGFGTASLGEYTLKHLSRSRVRKSGQLGAGVGVNYFFTRYLGLGVDAYAEGTDGVFVDAASASLILRFPLGHSGFAPQIFGGGGRQFEGDFWFGQVGAGMEYRFTPHVGAFLDARLVLPEEGQSSGVARLGMRFAF